MTITRGLSWVLLLAVLAIGCRPVSVLTAADAAVAGRTGECPPGPLPYEPTPAQRERDHIFMLTAYGVVFKDWQTAGWESASTRGYNIGGVLVDPDQQLVCWARNSNIRTRNGTQHGEVRLITNYLHNARRTSLKARSDGAGYTLYTTLEPCAMCSGMMTLQSLSRTLYGQSDPGFGRAVERLVLDSSELTEGFCPYPRAVQSIASDLDLRGDLDQAFTDSGERNITKWLTTANAKDLYAEAVRRLEEYRVQNEENETIIESAREFLRGVPSEYRPTPYSEQCSGNP